MSELPGKRSDGTKHRLPRHCSICGKSSRFVVSLALLYLASQVFLLVIAGILVAVFLSALAQWVQGLTKVSYRGSLGVVLHSIIALLWVCGYFAAPSIGRQMDELADRLPRLSSSKSRSTSIPGGDAC
jgi:predicted PurR-regulated permease PerM